MKTKKTFAELQTGDSVNGCKVFANDGGLIIYTTRTGLYEVADFRPYKHVKVAID